MIRRPKLSRKSGEWGILVGPFEALFFGMESIRFDRRGEVVPVAKGRRAKVDNDVCALKVRWWMENRP